jgi:hypothetical protein
MRAEAQRGAKARAAPWRLAVPLLFLAVVGTPASAQLYSDFDVPDASAAPANIYFGAARDNRGRYVSGATVVVATARLDFVAVTDRHGRFRLRLPVDVTPSDVEMRCSHNDYGHSRIRRRLPRGNALTPVELSCRLS